MVLPIPSCDRVVPSQSGHCVSPRKAFQMMDSENPLVTPRSPLHESSAQRQSSRASWPDSWLVKAIRREPPDEEALNALINRYWKPLYARCRLLTLDGERARDLAQETWLRLLRARHGLEPDKHLQGYIMTIATNLWRNTHRAVLRAGAVADDRMTSLESLIGGDEGESIALGNLVADPHTLSPADQLLLEMDLDNALALLEPRLRDVLISRYIGGESAAEIGRRYARTEQTITAWIRDAIRQMKGSLGQAYDLAAKRDNL